MKRVLLSALIVAAPVLGIGILGATEAAAQFNFRQQQQDQAPSVEQPQFQPLGPSKFDGTYSVDVTTQDGSCGNSHWTVVIRDAQVASVSPNTANISASGLIEDDGTVSLSFRGGEAGEHVAHVGGTVKGDAGKGFWSEPVAQCGGIWQAQRTTTPSAAVPPAPAAAPAAAAASSR